MVVLSTDLYRRCRSIFSKCIEFDDDASLRTLFVMDDLAPFRLGLPEAGRKSERIDATIAYLADQVLNNGRQVLPLFIGALRDRYLEGDSRRSELDRLALAFLPQEGPPTKVVPLSTPAASSGLASRTNPGHSSFDLSCNLAASNVCTFVGAGLSVGAGLPGWYDLIAELSSRIGYKVAPREWATGDALIDAAQAYVNRQGLHALISHLKDRLDTTGVQPTAAHRTLARLPMSLVFTANFDDLLERAYRDAGKRVEVVVKDSSIPFMRRGPDTVNIVKLYGDLDQPDTLVLARQQYESYFLQRPQMVKLLETTMATSDMLYLGWSGSDPYFKLVFGELLSRFGQMMRPGYAVMFDVTDDQRDELRRKQIQLVELSAGDRTASLAAWLESLAPISFAPDVSLNGDSPGRRTLTDDWTGRTWGRERLLRMPNTTKDEVVAVIRRFARDYLQQNFRRTDGGDPAEAIVWTDEPGATILDLTVAELLPSEKAEKYIGLTPWPVVFPSFKLVVSSLPRQGIEVAIRVTGGVELVQMGEALVAEIERLKHPVADFTGANNDMGRTMAADVDPGQAVGTESHDEGVVETSHSSSRQVKSQSAGKSSPRPIQVVPAWNTSGLRDLLTAAFNDEELTTLCFDAFRPIYEDFATGMSKGQKIQRLLDYCIRHEQVEDLLAAVRETNPTQYRRYESNLRE